MCDDQYYYNSSSRLPNLSFFLPLQEWASSCWPFIGMLPSLFPNRQILDFVSTTLESNHGTFLFKGPWFCNRDMVATTDPVNVQHVLSNNLSNYPKGPDTKWIFSAYGEVLFTADGDDWKYQRKILRAFFHSQRTQLHTAKATKEILEKGLIPVFDHASENGITIDLQDVFQRFMLDATFKMISSQNRGSLDIGLPKDAVLKALHDAGDAILLRHILLEKFCMLQRWLGVGFEKRLSEATKTLDDAAEECIKTWKERQVSSNNIVIKSLSNDCEESFDAITFCYKQKELLESIGEQDYVMRDIVKVLVFGGTDTAAPILPWFFWLLFKNPTAESKIRKELAENFGTAKPSTRLLIFDPKELNKLAYLHAAICESLRLYPSAPLQPRTSIQADVLPSGHLVKPNARIVICTHAMGRMKAIWGEDCLEFKPERWICEKSGSLKPVPSNKFKTFSSGPRICLGKEIGFARLKAVAATVLFNYQIHITKDQPAEATLAPSIFLRMKHGLMAKVSKV